MKALERCGLLVRTGTRKTGRRQENVAVSFATERVGAFADEYTMGNIGGKLVAPFVLVLDYQHSRIGFVPRGEERVK